jgi:hypothetical protein
VLERRGHVIREIVETERSFIKAMKLCVEEFYKPAKKFLPKPTLQAIFANIDAGTSSALCRLSRTSAVIVVNEQLLEMLTEGKKEISKEKYARFMLC